MLAVHELFLNHRHRTLQPWFTNGWRRKAVAVIIAIFCAAPFVGADEEEECEEGDEGCEPEFELTICAYLDAACSEPAGECLVRTDEDNSDCSTAEAEDEDEDGEPDSDELINTSPFGESEGYMRMNCDTVVKGRMIINFFDKEDCTKKRCLHKANRDDDLCKRPECRHETTRVMDPECECGMCKAGYPEGWENGVCQELKQPISCIPGEKCLSAMVSWEGEPCANAIQMQGIIVLLAILVPTLCIFLMLFVKWMIRKEKLCWRPGAKCCGRECGRRLIKLEEGEWMSKYEQKQKAKEDNVKNTDRWGKFKAEERTVADKHEAFRQTLNADNNALKTKSPPGTAKSKSSRNTVHPTAGSKAGSAPIKTSGKSKSNSGSQRGGGRRKRGP